MNVLSDRDEICELRVYGSPIDKYTTHLVFSCICLWVLLTQIAANKSWLKFQVMELMVPTVSCLCKTLNTSCINCTGNRVHNPCNNYWLRLLKILIQTGVFSVVFFIFLPCFNTKEKSSPFSEKYQFVVYYIWHSSTASMLLTEKYNTECFLISTKINRRSNLKMQILIINEKTTFRNSVSKSLSTFDKLNEPLGVLLCFITRYICLNIFAQKWSYLALSY